MKMIDNIYAPTKYYYNDMLWIDENKREQILIYITGKKKKGI
jgi:hypothetical protein